MIFWLVDWISGGASPADLTESTLLVRCAAAAVLLLLLAVLCGPAAIAWLSRRFREPIKGGSAQVNRLHHAKQATPTMGGLFLVAGLALSMLAVGNLANPLLLVTLALVAGLTLLGSIDDLVKLRSTARGLGWQAKLLGQIGIAAIPAMYLYCAPGDGAAGLALHLPGGLTFVLGWLAIPWTILVIVATSNAVNITDGLDGLAAGCLALATLAVGVAGYVLAIGEARELLVVAAAMAGVLSGFLRFNRHPAQVFMGNVGALPLGGLLGMLAVATGTERFLPLAAGVFVVEAGSVILQIGWYKLTRKRIFRCAPLHHHFEFQGWQETSIVRRFWLTSAVCAVLGVALAFASLPDDGVRSAPPRIPTTEMAALAVPEFR